MRRSIFVFLLACFCISVNGQFSLAPEIGVNTGKFTQSDFFIADSKSKANVFIGVHTMTALSDKYALGFDVEYSFKGYRLGVDSIFNSNEPEYKYTYLDFQPYLIRNVNQNLSFGAGAYLGLNIKEEYKDFFNDWEDIGQFDTFSAVDYGLLFNVRYTVDRFMLKFEYNHGLKDVSDIVYTDFEGNLIGEANQKLRNFQIGIGYYLNPRSSGT